MLGVAPKQSDLSRIAVVGTSGTGKTTFAKRWAQQSGVKHIELDALHWGPNWQGTEQPVFLERVHAATTDDAWVCDGNYSAVQDAVLARATTVIWLDYPFFLTLDRVLRRTWQRWRHKQTLWADNRERLSVTLFHPDSIIWWMVRTHGRNRRKYQSMLVEAETPFGVIAFKHPRELAAWFEQQATQTHA